MTERVRRPSLRLWPLLVLAVLAAGLLVDRIVPSAALPLANPDRARTSELEAALAALPEEPNVIVGMDPDLGTYPEVRAAVRATLARLLAADARLAFVSFTPEGRAAAAAELDRLARAGVAGDRVLDLGFVAGAEAGLVLSVTDLALPDESEAAPPLVSAARAGLSGFDLALVVGGVDFGPRSWVEQVATRVPQLPLVAVVPTFQHPEVAPFLRSGQLDALLGTVRDGAAWVALAQQEGTEPPPAATAMLVGMLIALFAIGRFLAGGGRRTAEPASLEDGEEVP